MNTFCKCTDIREQETHHKSVIMTTDYVSQIISALSTLAGHIYVLTLCTLAYSLLSSLNFDKSCFVFTNCIFTHTGKPCTKHDTKFHKQYFN